ncbi:MAG: sterol desaturase family protein [Acidimicrobiales bacterium]|nr:sterol desaturase family protein [Acidimicrobiales bacterium]
MTNEATPYELVIAAPYAVGLVAVILEVTWLSRTDRAVWRRARTALAMAGGAVAVGVVYATALRALWGVVLSVSPLRGVWQGREVAATLIAFVAWDAMGWVYHWVGHRTQVGWASHQPHHSGTTFDITLGLRQTWTPFHGLAYQPLLALAGFDFATIAVCAALSNTWQLLNHSAAPVAWPRWLSLVVMTPDTHRLHHASDAVAVNLGPVFTAWDRLARTWETPREMPTRYGANDGGALAVELAGWRALLLRR